MKTALISAFLAAAVMLPPLDAQQPTTSQQTTPQVELPKSQIPTLGRPTKATDPQPLLDFAAYFTGTWTFTWDFPESPLGPAGALTGTTVYKAIDARFFEAITEGTMDATSPGRVVKITEVIGYQRENRSVSRLVTDSRGFSFMQVGVSGGDLGGFFTIHSESAPFVYNGHSVRLKTSTRLLSPLNYRVQTTISVDGGPFTNYGNPWFRKVVPGLTGPS